MDTSATRVPGNRASLLVAFAQVSLAATLGFAWRGIAGAMLGGAGGVLLATLAWQRQRRAGVRVLAAEQAMLDAQAEAEASRLAQQGRGHELALLGRYGNLLIACTDLAEVLQTSQQMLSQLLPDSAGTIYPLIDGEGLAEATHLWGVHAADTRTQSSAEDCWCMQRHRLHPSGSAAADSLCGHVIAPARGAFFTTACIPLMAQGESLGWLYLSAVGIGHLPKLAVAAAAADQLALALANLRLRQTLRDLSVRDPLTGLFNRRYLSESLAREIARARRRGKSVAVMAFDLDHFKSFNDAYGHPAGDTVLVAFARILQANSRSEDIACRQGGEEFVLILPEMEMDVAMRRAGDLMKALERLKLVHDGRLLPALTTSIGLATFPAHGATPDTLLAKADAALYDAKSRGRNRFSVAAGD